MKSIKNSVLSQIIGKYIGNIQKELVERWNSTQPTNSSKNLYQVIIGLLSRQVSLNAYFLQSPLLWNGDIGPIIIRSIVENIINIKWILQDDAENRAKLFTDYGLSQEKLHLEHLKSKRDSLEGTAQKDLTEEIDKLEQLLNQERYSFLTDVNLGSWCEKPIRTIAEECGLKELYTFLFVPFSNASHGTWNHIIHFNLKRSSNPLHQFRRRPIYRNLEPDIEYVDLTASLMSRSFETFDSYFKSTATYIDSYDILIEDFNAAADKVNQKSS